MFKVIIAGGRKFDDYELLRDSCRKILTSKHPDVIVISGTAKGADQLGEVFAVYHDYKVERYPADWENFGKRAGHVRNSQMAKAADALIAFHDGKSLGTRNMIEQMQSLGKPVRVIRY